MAKHKQTTCDCGAYNFPHRVLSGKCKAINFIEEYYQAEYHGGCLDCILNMNGSCEVLEGREHHKYCGGLQEYIRLFEIRVPKSWKI